MNNIYKYLFFFLVLFYAIFISQFGFENWDTGYITSFSWRILNGQNPYSDFFYKFPPVSIYWHAFWLKILPENGQYYFTRVVNYLLFGLQVFLTVTAFDKWFDFKSLKVSKWGIMCLGFTISLLDFPAFAWNTIDGLLFASVAFYLMSYRNQNFGRLLLIAIFCMLSALTKQSFYLVPLLFLAWILLENGFKKVLIYLAFVTILIGGYAYFIHEIAGFDNYLRLTTGETNLSGLIYVGFHEYHAFFSNIWISIAVLIVTLSAVFLNRRKQPNILQNFAKVFPLVLFATSIIMCFLNEFKIASRIAFVALALIVVCKFLFEKYSLKLLFPIIVALGIAWSASISFGYSYPIFYSTTLIAGIVALAYADIQTYISAKYISIIAVLIFFFGFSNVYRLYREKPIPELTHSMGAISPKLMFVKSSAENFEKHLELKNLVSEYGPTFIVAPSIPAAHYLFNEQSTLPADWIINTEVNRQYDFFVKLASDKKNYIFLEKSYLAGEEMSLPNKREHSEISWQIYSTFQKIDETKHFIIYNGIK